RSYPAPAQGAQRGRRRGPDPHRPLRRLRPRPGAAAGLTAPAGRAVGRQAPPLVLGNLIPSGPGRPGHPSGRPRGPRDGVPGRARQRQETMTRASGRRRRRWIALARGRGAVETAAENRPRPGAESRSMPRCLTVLAVLLLSLARPALAEPSHAI